MGGIGDGQDKRLTQILDPFLAGDRLTRTFTGAGIGLGSLASDRQATAMTHPAIRLDFAETTDVLSQLTTQRTFHRVVTLEQRRDPTKFILLDVTCRSCRVNSQFLTDLTGAEETNAV